MKTAIKPPTGNKLVCTYCGAENPDSEAICPDTGGHHSLVSSADKEKIGQGYGPGPADKTGRPTTLSGQHEEDYKKESHGFAQTDTVKHCPFCGSGDVWGGSDGTITCEFDGATFQVSVEPQYPSAPGSIDGQPLNIDGEPDPFGQASAGDAMAGAEGVAGGPDDQLGLDEEGGPEDEQEGGPPWANGGDGDEEEDEDEDEGAPPPFPPKKSYRTHAGDLLSEDLYVKHLAIRHAEAPRQFLASLRSGR